MMEGEVMRYVGLDRKKDGEKVFGEMKPGQPFLLSNGGITAYMAAVWMDQRHAVNLETGDICRMGDDVIVIPLASKMEFTPHVEREGDA